VSDDWAHEVRHCVAVGFGHQGHFLFSVLA